MNDGFVSVVANHENKEHLLVRGRSRKHLENIFKGYKDPQTNKPFVVHETPGNDYGFRVFCSKGMWTRIVTDRVRKIDYTNFKNSVKEDKLHRLYEDFWHLHIVYQDGKEWWKKKLAYATGKGSK